VRRGVVGDDDSVELEEQASEEESEDDFEEEETDEEGEEGWKQPRKRAKTSTKAPAAAQKKKPQPAAKPAAAAKPAPAAVAGDLGARLLAALSGESQTAAQLGKALGQPKSAVNSLLYKLASSGQAVKEDGVGAPKWRAAGAAADAAAATRLKMEPVDAPAPAAVPAAPAVTAPAPPPPTAAPAAAVASGDDSTKIADLGSNKRLTVSRYKGQTFINIREYYLKDGAMLPGSKGISLPVEQWRKVCDAAPAVDQALQARK